MKSDHHFTANEKRIATKYFFLGIVAGLCLVMTFVMIFLILDVEGVV